MRHGVDCTKLDHDPNRVGYEHSENYDGPYDVDGVPYCGRCHYWMGCEIRVSRNPPAVDVQRALYDALKRCVIEMDFHCHGHSDAEISIAKSALALYESKGKL
jgi:hypothetical protein